MLDLIKDHLAQKTKVKSNLIDDSSQPTDHGDKKAHTDSIFDVKVNLPRNISISSIKDPESQESESNETDNDNDFTSS